MVYFHFGRVVCRVIRSSRNLWADGLTLRVVLRVQVGADSESSGGGGFADQTEDLAVVGERLGGPVFADLTEQAAFNRSATCSTCLPHRANCGPKSRRSTSAGRPPAPPSKRWSASSRKSCACWISGSSSVGRSRAPRPPPRRRIARCRAPRPAEPRPLAGERRHRLRRALRFARSRAGAGAPGRQTAGRCVPHRSIARGRLRDYLSGLEANPGRLEEIENRLALLDKLKRKYGKSIAEVLAFLAEVRAQIEQVEHAGERMDELRKERERLARDYEQATGELTALRTRAARKLEKGVEAELRSLAMERTTFRIEIAPAPWSAAGADRVEFLVSPNLGEEPKPLEKVASGGEISRIALALKTCLSDDVASRRTLVFDEVDAGIGGRAAEGVGRRLKKLAAANQVLCVTHLAQIAAFADHRDRSPPHAFGAGTDAGRAEARRAVNQKRGVKWGRPPGPSGWACGPRIVMKTQWGRPSACGGLSGRPEPAPNSPHEPSPQKRCRFLRQTGLIIVLKHLPSAIRGRGEKF